MRVFLLFSLFCYLLLAEVVTFSKYVPVYKSVEIERYITKRVPYEECWEEEVPQESGSDTLGAIIGGGFYSYQLAVIIANSIAKALMGQGLAFAVNAGIAKGLAIFAGPIGWAVTGGLAAIGLAGPGRRVTIPATIYLASLRQAERYKAPIEKKKLTVFGSFVKWLKQLPFMFSKK